MIEKKRRFQGWLFRFSSCGFSVLQFYSCMCDVPAMEISGGARCD